MSSKGDLRATCGGGAAPLAGPAGPCTTIVDDAATAAGAAANSKGPRRRDASLGMLNSPRVLDPIVAHVLPNDDEADPEPCAARSNSPGTRGAGGSADDVQRPAGRLVECDSKERLLSLKLMLARLSPPASVEQLAIEADPTLGGSNLPSASNQSVSVE
mmetsp:Transcript_32803/g.94392  ORF Transcript_32803/g.94392 Transcript_32803/m.94392 type:complete len:159 (-) Transcript_32803:321-797(-)